MLPVRHFGDETFLLVGGVVHLTDGLVVGLQEAVGSLYFVSIAMFFLLFVVLGLVVLYFVFIFEFWVGLHKFKCRLDI